MSSIRLVMFDLAGTTVHDEGYVARCLFLAAQETGVVASEREIGQNIGTNKRDLYKLLIARQHGREAPLSQIGAISVTAEEAELAERAFVVYERLMLQLYRREIKPTPGAEETFRWLRSRGIKVATDTGFHKQINLAIMDSLGWLREGLVDAALDVQDVPGERGRPAPFMIFRAMELLSIDRVRDVVKVGDQPADMLEGTNAGCRGVVGVLSGPLDAATIGAFPHTHLIPSVADLPALCEREGWA